MSESASVDPDRSDIFDAPLKAGAPAPPVVRATDLTGVHVIKSGDMFMLNNAHGDVRPDGRGLGLFLRDTRFLSTYDLLRGLRVGAASVDLEFSAQDGSISVEVLRRTGDLDVVVRL